MRLVAVVGCWLFAVAVDLGCAIRPADAQAVMQQSFGAPVSSPRFILRRLGRGGFRDFRLRYGRGAYISQPYNWRDGPGKPDYEADETTYQTMCVRMCDGYYWPVGAATPRWRMHEDAQRCSASCDAEVRLFYRPISSIGAASMSDMEGRSYSQLPNAFRYRKSLVRGCMCRPAPWSVDEAERHRRYAAENAAMHAGDWRQSDINAEAVAGVYPRPERKAPVTGADVQEDASDAEAERDQAWGAYQNPPLVWNARPRVRYVPAPRYGWPGNAIRR